MFALTRKFGKLKDIIIQEDKRIARIHFKNIHNANAARNCLDGKVINGTTLDINSVPVSFKIPIDILTSPRAIVPLTGATIASISLLLNPIRIYFVTQKLTIEKGVDYIGESGSNYAILNSTELETNFRNLVNNKPSNVLLIIGPKGSDKSTIVKKVIQKRMFTTRIDCQKISTTQEFIDQFGRDIGFRPSFAALNTIFVWFSSFVPNAATLSHDVQITSLLKCLDRALLVRKATNITPIIVFDEFDRFLKLMDSDNKDEANRATSVLSLIGTWAYTTTRNGNAHVIFVSNNTHSEEHLRKFDCFNNIVTIPVKDISKEHAEEYLVTQLREVYGNDLPKKYSSIKDAVNLIGGRLGDLDHLLFLVSKNGSIESTLELMLENAIKNIRKRGFGNHIYGQNSKAEYKPQQLWKVINVLKDKDSIDYDTALIKIFDGDERAIRGIVDQNLITVDYENNGKKVIKAFSPLYLIAFRKIIADNPVFSLGMDKSCKQMDIDKEMAVAEKIENELLKLTKTLEVSKSFEDHGIIERINSLNEQLLNSSKKLNVLKRELDEIIMKMSNSSPPKKETSSFCTIL